jgi:hemerythrin-like metal-binding protein
MENEPKEDAMEPKTAWEQEQQLGVATIDSEHALQARLVAVLREAVETGRDHAVVAEILRRVEDTSNVHFMSEELLMRLDAYDQYGQHVEEHRKLLHQLAQVRHRFEADPAYDLKPNVGFIEDWLTNHIKGMDRRFTEQLKQGKSGTP